MLPSSGLVWLLLLLLTQLGVNVLGEIEYNTINDDGSFTFRHTNDDIGGYYHSASGSPDNIVRGRYGSRNPTTGRVEEVVYTAGPRGFRANGPKIHRKMDLAQYPPRAVGSPDDPLADPYDDPSYSFSFRTAEQSRSESNDATGRVRGLYSYIDDVGERHSVRYAAGAGTGFEVANAVPDNPISVNYGAPLYKAHPKTRGKMSVQRGPGGSYKLIAAGPDHRRAESRGSDGLVRGTYSYLDDKGVQRTVEYIAGAGIGYRIVGNKIGPGTHVNPSVSDFRLTDTDFRLANEFGSGAGGGGGGVGGAGRVGSAGGRGGGSGGRGSSSGGRGGGGGGGGEYLQSSGSGRIRPNDDDRFENDLTDNDNNDDDDVVVPHNGNRRVDSGGSKGGSASASGNVDTKAERNKSDRMGGVVGGRGGTRYRGSSTGGSGDDSYPQTGGRGGTGSRTTSSRNDISSGERNRNRGSSRRGGSGSGSSYNNNDGYSYDPPSSANNYNFKDDDVSSLPPLITPNRKVLEIDRDRDWLQRDRDSTLIKNVGKWYIGLPPGQSVRAHVQNIDLLPLGGRRRLSPSEALRQDEIADMVASLETGAPHNSKEHRQA